MNLKTHTVYWTKESEDTFKNNIDYLSKNWNKNVLLDFLKRVDIVIQNIAENPSVYPYHRKKEKVRKAVIHSRIILFFKQIDERTIHLLTFWNTYQNPKKLKT